MFEVQRAIHVRSGQRAAADALDGWLARHGVVVDAFTDVYQACVHLLRNFEQVPDLALVGLDWLADDECSIIPYLRHTWPRIGLVLYGAELNTPLIDVLPMTLACRLGDPLRELLAQTPRQVLQRLSTRQPAVAPLAPPQPRRGPDSWETPTPNPRNPSGQSTSATDPRGTSAARKSTPAAPPRSLLTPEELSALLNGSEEN